MLKLYSSTTSANVVRDFTQGELDELQKAYNFLIQYEMIEQKYSVICNNNIDLDTSLVQVHHQSMNNMSPAVLMYANCEINRRLFNSLSAYYAYYEFMDELYKEKIPDISTFDFRNYFKAILDKEELMAFGWDLRHYYNHYGFPCKSINVRFDRPYPPIMTSAVVLGLSMNFDKSNLNAKFKWLPMAQSLIGKQQPSFDVLPMVNKYFCAWIDIHRTIRQHYLPKLEWAKKFIQTLFIEANKNIDTDILCIADYDKVQTIPNTPDNLAIFNEAALVHGQFIQRVKYYMDHFNPGSCPSGRFITLAPK